MSPVDRLLRPFARAAHPRLLALVAIGATVGLVGTALALATPGAGSGPGTLGFRLAVVGYLVFLVGGSGYVAFSVFERGFD